MKAVFTAAVLTTTIVLSGVQAEPATTEAQPSQQRQMREAQIKMIEDAVATKAKTKEEEQAVHSVADLARQAAIAEEAKEKGRELTEEEKAAMRDAKTQAAEDIAKTQTKDEKEKNAISSFFNFIKVASETE